MKQGKKLAAQELTMVVMVLCARFFVMDMFAMQQEKKEEVGKVHIGLRDERTSDELKVLNNRLLQAANDDDIQMARTALEEGAYSNIRDVEGNTPLLWAAQEGHEEMVMLLLKSKASARIANNDGETPLMKVASRGYVHIARVLLNYNAHPREINGVGETALIKAYNAHQHDMVKMLIEAGADYSFLSGATIKTIPGLSEIIAQMRC